MLRWSQKSKNILLTIKCISYEKINFDFFCLKPVFWLLLWRNGVSEVLYQTELRFAFPILAARPIF